MKKIILAVILTVASSQALAWMMLVSCRYEYNSDLNMAVYVGTYKASSGRMYTQFFPANRYGWCPSNI